MKRETVVEIGVFSLLVIVGVVSRLAAAEWHVWNFASVTASALFAGYYLSYRRVAFLVPLLIMAISNLWLPGYPHNGMLWVIYASFLLPVLLRSVLRYSLLTLIFCAVGSSVGFFLISNFAQWYFIDSVGAVTSIGALDGSPKTLLEVYVAALPFFKYTLLGDLGYSLVLFGSYVLAARVGYVPSVESRLARAEVAA